MANVKNNNTGNDIAIKVENLSKTFIIPHEKNNSLKSAALGVFSANKEKDIFHSLNKVSFEVKKGEFFGIIGRNGSGKSTLLKILAGIYIPDKDSGKVIVNGRLSPFLELGVGFNPELTGRENVFLGGAVLGLSRKDVLSKYDKIVAFAELEEFMDMKFKNFSSGMQVRLAFALSINAHAEILLMDEVLAVGDTNFQTKCIREFNKYKKSGKTVILVSHDLNSIERYCDRVLLLESGRIIALDNPEVVINQYKIENINDNIDKKTTVIIKNKYIKQVLYIVDGKESKQPIQGKDMSFRFYLEGKNLPKEFNLGIGLHSEENGNVFSCNTQMDSFITKGMGIIDITFNELPLLSGSYFANVTIYKDLEQSPLEFLPRCLAFEVLGPKESNQYRGVVKLKHKWEAIND